MKAWPKVALGELVSQIARTEPVKPDGEYRLLGVRLEGNGAFHRETVLGTETSATRLSRIETGDFIYSRLFAWRGAFGIIGSDLNGCYVSNECPLFNVDAKRLNSSYLNRWFQLPATWRRVEEDCSGSTPTTRNRFKEGFFLKLEIPLPPLAEQQALVARLDALAEKTRQLEAHLDAAERNAERVVLALHQQLANGREVALSEVLELHEEPAAVVPGESYPQVGVRSFGGGLFSKTPVAAHETTYRAFNRLYADAIVLSQVKGWEGAIARTPPELVSMYASPEYRTFRCRQGQAVPGYIAEICKTPWFWSLLQDATRGVGARRERTRPEQLLNVRLPMPTVEKQQEAANIFTRLTALKAKHTALRAANAANAALLPALLERVFSSPTP